MFLDSNTLTVSNAGVSFLSGVQKTDTRPGGITFRVVNIFATSALITTTEGKLNTCSADERVSRGILSYNNCFILLGYYSLSLSLDKKKIFLQIHMCIHVIYKCQFQLIS